MTELDPDTKARIEAEERYRAELRAQQGQVPPAAPTVTPATPAPKKKGIGCGAVIGYSVLAVIVFGVIGNMLGGSDSSSSSTTPTTSSTPSTPTPASTPAPEPDPEPTEDTGDATLNADGSQDIGVWRVSDVTWQKLRSVGGTYGSTADAGETFVSVKFTLKNKTNDTQNYSSMIDQPQLILSDGGTIDADTMLSIEAGGQMIDGQIAPGLKRSGQYVFRVPSDNSSDMKFQLQFFGGKRLVVKLVE